MKYIEIPAEVALVAVTGEKVVNNTGDQLKVSFKEFVLGRLTEKSFGAGMDSVLSAVKIRDLVEEANGTLELEDSDWNRLRVAVKQGTYDPRLAYCLIPHMEAVEKASSEDPNKKEEPAEESEDKALPEKTEEATTEE